MLAPIRFLKQHRKVPIVLLGVVLILVLVIFGLPYLRQYFKSLSSVTVEFKLEASQQDVAGVDSNTSFILKASRNLSIEAVKEILVFKPKTEFAVKKLNTGLFGSLNLFQEVFAQGLGDRLLYSFEIKPKEGLKESSIYQVSIGDEDVVEREYSWAFQVKAPFQIISTHPRNKGTSVPINSGIEITFNREDFINPQDYFEISPTTEWGFEASGNTLVFLPKELNPTTVYTVTIKKGLKVRGSDEALSEDYTFYFETSYKKYEAHPYFEFGDDFLEFIPGKKPAFKISLYKLDINTVDFSVYKLSSLDEFLGSYQESRKWSLGWTYYYRRRVGSAYEPSQESKVLSFKPELIKIGYEKFIEIPQILEEGYYFIDAKGENLRRQAWLQITPVTHYFSITNEQSLIWLYNFTKGQPLGGVNLTFIEGAQELSLGQTDNEGLAQFLTPENLKDENPTEVIEPQFFKIASQDHLPVLAKIADSWGYSRKVSKGDVYWDYLSTDRYTYQMTDTLRYWAVLKGRSQDLKGKKVSLGIYKGWWRGSSGEPLVIGEAVISSFDTIEGILQFKGLTPGYYNLTVTLGDETISNTSIQVLTYTKPAYQIKVTPSKTTIFAGQEVRFDIEAAFFDGTPVSKLKLKYNAYWQNSIYGELVLDEFGKGTLAYTPSYWATTYWPRSFNIDFSPKMSEEGEIWGSGSVLVFGPDIYLQSFQKKILKDTYQFKAKLNQIVLEDIGAGTQDISRREYIGDPVKNHEVRAEIKKITYRRIETGQYYDYINKIVRKSYRYVREEKTVKKLTGATNSSGEWSFEYSLPKEEGSTYRVDFSARGSQGRLAKSSTYVWYAAYGSWRNFSTSLNIGGSSYQEEFSIGENIELELQILEGSMATSSKVLFYRWQNSIDQAVVTSFLNYSQTFEASFLPSVQYKAVVLGPYGFDESNSVTAAFKEADNELLINVEQDKASYRPGDEVTLKFSVKDKAGEPTASEINIAVVDEALFHILPYEYYSRDILKGLYSNIYTYPLSRATEYAFLEAAEKSSAEQGGCFGKGTLVLMADGGVLPIEEIRIGDEILTWSDTSKKFISVIVQNLSEHWVGDYLIINHSLIVTPEHLLNINGKWTPAGKIELGDKLFNKNKQSVEVFSIKERQGKVPVYNIVVSGNHTYFAGGFWVHNEEKGGAPRINFVDVAFYKSLSTNKDGKAEVTFKLPDNITSWRVTTRAFASGNLKAGQDVKLIKTTLPFFVEATLSKFYLVGDSPTMRVRAFGTEFEQGKDVEFEVNCDSLGLQEKKVSSDNTIYLSLGTLSEGEHEIVIQASQANLEDAIVKNFEVVESYFKMGESSFYELSSELTDIKGNVGGFTRLKFVDLGKGRLYWPLWRAKYSSGIRIDQIVPKYLSSKYLREYFGEPLEEEPLDLAPYHLGNGSLGLFPYSDGDLSLSAKLADLVPEYVFKEKLKKYFNDSVGDKKADIHRISLALYGLAAFGELVLVKINRVLESPELNLEDRVYLALALAKLGDKENARTIYFDKIRNELRFQGRVAWLAKENDATKRVKLTGLIAVLASELGLDDTHPLGEYLFTHHPEKDLDTLEEFLYIKSELARSEESQVKFKYETNKRSESIELRKGRMFGITLADDELQSIRFSNVEGDIALISFYERARDPDELTKNPELTLDRIYLVGGRPTSSFKEGDVVKVQLDPKIAESAIDGRYQVIDFLPSGLKPITQIYRQGISGGSVCNPVWYPSIIENNIVYFNIWKGFNKTRDCTNRTLNYYARVVSKGNYQGNPAVIQSLKDLESLNLSSKSQIKIE